MRTAAGSLLLSARIDLPDGQGETEGAPWTGGVILDPDLSAVISHDALHDCETQARAAGPVGDEGLEDDRTSRAIRQGPRR